MSYVSVATLRNYKDIDSSTEDWLLEKLIAAAQKVIDRRTGRTFEASADTIRYLDAVANVEGRTLYLDKDLCYIKTVTINADGSVPIALLATDFITIPRNETPYWAIKLVANSGYTWQYYHDPENGIKIEGKWAYSTASPDDIAYACQRLAVYFYQLKNAQVFDVTAQPDMGIITIPKGIPADVERILAPYVKAI